MVDICLCGIAREDCDYHKPAPVVSQVPVYDVSGTSFIPGVTQFTIENVQDAAALRLSVLTKLDVHSALYSRIRKCHLLDTKNGIAALHDWYIHTQLELFMSCKQGSVFDTLLTFEDGSEMILRTREA